VKTRENINGHVHAAQAIISFEGLFKWLDLYGQDLDIRDPGDDLREEYL